MRIIQRYFTVTLVSTSLIALCVLVALFCFFSLIDQLEETGKGNYGVGQAVLYVILTIPRLSYELFPIAAVIGSMAALGMMAQNSELAVTFQKRESTKHVTIQGCNNCNKTYNKVSKK